MTDDQAGICQIESEPEFDSTGESKSFRFGIRDLIILTALVAMAFSIPLPDLLLAMVAAGFIAVSCLGASLVYLFPRIQKLTKAEEVFIRLARYLLVICLVAIVLCAFALFLRIWFSVDPAQTWNELYLGTDQY